MTQNNRQNGADGTQPDEVLTLHEVAVMLRISGPTVQRWARSGWIPAAKIGKEYRVRRADFEAWYAQRRVQAPIAASGGGDVYFSPVVRSVGLEGWPDAETPS